MNATRWLPLFWPLLPALAAPRYAAVETVLADGVPIVVSGYSIPELADWNGDGLPDLLVGDGGVVNPQSRVRLYLNQGAPGAPAFGACTYMQAAGAEISHPSSSCMGVCPRVADWNADSLPDLLLGRTDGTVLIYLNVGTPGNPQLAAATSLLVGPAGGQTALDVGSRATLAWTDWNGDGLPDLVTGAMDGLVRLSLNQGAPGAPLLATPVPLPASPGVSLIVTSGRSAPVVEDVDGDGLPDLICGNTNGQLLYYRNQGSAESALFPAQEAVLCGGVAFDLAGTLRSRPAACDWNEDGLADLLVGYGDGQVRLCLAPPAPVPLAATVADGRLHLSWPACSPRDHFRVHRADLGQANWSLVAETDSTGWSQPLPETGGALFRVTHLH